MPQDIETKKKIVAEYPDMTWDDFLKMEELRGRPIELIEDMDRIPCEEISSPKVFSMQPLVSVHMITYNHEKYIEEAINGVVHQQCNFPFELIIGEDCSTDCTRKICLEYQIKFPGIIRVLVSKENVGSSKNSRRVTLRARGKYLAFCEGDDYWTDINKLQMQVNVMEQHPDIGLVCTNYCTKHELTGKFEQLTVRLDDGDENLHDEVLYRDNFQRVQTAGVLIRHETYMSGLSKELIFRCRLGCGDIQTFLNSVYPNGKYYVISKCTYVYRRTPAGASFGDSQFSLIIDGFICRYFYMLKIHISSPKDDVLYKYLFLSLSYKILENIKHNRSNDHISNEIQTMTKHIAQDHGKAYPLSVKVLQKTPLNFYSQFTLRQYTKELCQQMEKNQIPLCSINQSKLIRVLPSFFSSYTCVCIHYFIRKCMSLFHVNPWE